jgi:ABC-type Fe3+ transport system substrate-binding protein
MTVSRRGFLATAAGATAAACAPGASPEGGGIQGSPERPLAEWEKQWNELLEAARREGKVVVQTAAGAGYRETIEQFNKAFPGVEAEHVQFPDAATYVPKITQERNAGVYSFDAALLPPTSALQQLKPIGAYEDLRPVIFRPDVLDDKGWDGGFAGRWRDVDKKLAFSHMRNVNHGVWVNTEMVKLDEIKSVDDLLKPQWRGKFVVADPRQGASYLTMTTLRLNGRGDAVQKLLQDQEPNIIRDRRQAVEAVVRGRFPIAIGLLVAVVNEFKNQGVGVGVKQPDMIEMDYQPSDCTFLFNKAPHPNAAKLFINWFLTKEGGTAYAQNVKVNSARLDAPVADPDSMPKAGVEYKMRNQEEIYGTIAEVQKEVIALTGG